VTHTERDADYANTEKKTDRTQAAHGSDVQLAFWEGFRGENPGEFSGGGEMLRGMSGGFVQGEFPKEELTFIGQMTKGMSRGCPGMHVPDTNAGLEVGKLAVTNIRKVVLLRNLQSGS